MAIVQCPNTNQKVVFKQVIAPGQAGNAGVTLFTTPASQATVQIPITNGLQTGRNQNVIPNLVLPSSNINNASVLANRIVIQKTATQPLTVPGLILLNKTVKTKTDTVKRKAWTHIQSHPGKFIYQKNANHEPTYLAVTKCAMPASVSYCIGTTNSSPTLTVARSVPTNSFQIGTANLNLNMKSNEIAVKVEPVSETTKRNILHNVVKSPLVLENPLCLVGSKKMFKTNKKLITTVIKSEDTAKMVPSAQELHKSTKPGSTVQTFTSEWGKATVGEVPLCATVIVPNPVPVNQQTNLSSESTFQLEQKPINLNQTMVPENIIISSTMLPPICAPNTEEKAVSIFTGRAEDTLIPVKVSTSDSTTIPIFIPKNDNSLPVTLSTDQLISAAIKKNKSVLTQKKSVKNKDHKPIVRKNPVIKKCKNKVAGIANIKLEDTSSYMTQGCSAKIFDSSSVLTSSVSTISSPVSILSPITTCNNLSGSNSCTNTMVCSSAVTNTVSSFSSSIVSSQKQIESLKTVTSITKLSPSPTIMSSAKCTTKKKNLEATSEEVTELIEKITTAAAKLEQERGKKATVKAVYSNAENSGLPKKKKKKTTPVDHEGCPTSPRDITVIKVVCEDCGRSFVSTYNLRRHVKNLHNKILPVSSSQITSLSNQIEPFGSTPFDHTIPQLHIADDEEQFHLLDEAFLHPPPMLNPPKTALNKIPDSISLTQSNGCTVLANTTESTVSNTTTTSSDVPNDSLQCNDSVGNPDEPVTKFLNEQYVFQDLCSNVEQLPSTSEQNDTKDNIPNVENSIFENHCVSTDQYLKDELYQQEAMKPSEIEASIKIEPLNQEPSSQSNDIISYDQWIKPTMSDMDIFGNKPELVYDILIDDIKPDLNSIAPSPDESYKFTADLSKFEAINETSSLARNHSPKAKSVKGSKNLVDVKIKSEEFNNNEATGVSTPTLLKELFENDSDFSKTQTRPPPVTNEQGEKMGFTAELVKDMHGSEDQVIANLYDVKETNSTSSFLDESRGPLFPLETTIGMLLSNTTIKVDDQIKQNDCSIVNPDEIAVSKKMETESVKIKSEPLDVDIACLEDKAANLNVEQFVSPSFSSNSVDNVMNSIMKLLEESSEVIESIPVPSTPEISTSTIANENCITDSSSEKDAGTQSSVFSSHSEKINPKQDVTADSSKTTLDNDSSSVVKELVEEIVSSLCGIEPQIKHVKKPTRKISEPSIVARDSQQLTAPTCQLAKISGRKTIRCKSAPMILLNEVQIVLKKCKDPETEMLRQNQHHASPSRSTPFVKIMQPDSELNLNSVEPATKCNTTESKVQYCNKYESKLHTSESGNTSEIKIHSQKDLSAVPTKDQFNAVPSVQSTDVTTDVKIVLRGVIDRVVKRGLGNQKPRQKRKRSFPRIVPLQSKRPSVSSLNSSNLTADETLLHSGLMPNAASSFANNKNCNSSLTTDHKHLSECDNIVVKTEMDFDSCVNQSADTDACFVSCHETPMKIEKSLLDYCDETSIPDLSRVKMEPINVYDANLAGTRSGTDLAVAVRESSRIRDKGSHAKRMCHCCVESAPSPSTIRKCRTNSGSSNGSNGNSTLLPVVPLVPVKTVNTKNIVAQVKKKKKSGVLSKINTRSKPAKPRTRSTIVP